VNNIQQGQAQPSPEEQWLKEEEDARKSPIDPDLKMAVSDGQAPKVTMSSYQPPQPSTGSLPQLPPGSAPLPPVADSPAAPAAAPTPDLSADEPVNRAIQFQHHLWAESSAGCLDSFDLSGRHLAIDRPDDGI
jgi:hypothetical protein